MKQRTSGLQKASQWLLADSRLLIAGSVIALIWAHVDFFGGTHTLENFTHFELGQLFAEPAAHAADAGHAEHGMTIHLLIGMAMAFFFGIAGKEVKESTLPGGDLNPPSKAAVPLFATAGGILGPIGVYLLLALLVGKFTLYVNGWAIPTATDIAFSYYFGNMIFGKGSPPVKFLLLLAIADDAVGLVIIAFGYTDYNQIHLMWLLLPTVAVVLTIVTARLMQGHRNHSHWLYFPFMIASLYGFYRVGVEPALAFVPVIWFMPHAATDLGLFAHGESERHDTLNQFEHFWKPWVEGILFFFALTNVGVPLAGIGIGTLLVAVALIVGKTLGVLGCTWFAVKVFGLRLPDGMTYKVVTCIGMIAGIGFTVALFVAVKAFGSPEYAMQLPEAKLGALFSFLAAPLAIWYARYAGIKPVDATQNIQQPAELGTQLV
jgi:NhaA family Na+:H+ antiporter